MATPLPTPTPQQVTIDKDSYHLVAFYYPGYNEPWDDVYNAPFLANFWVTGVTITVLGETATFHTAEAAFQALKWWDKKDAKGNPITPQFAACTDGNAAFTLRKRLSGDPKHHIPPEVPPDLNYAGLGRDGAMQKVLEAKFKDIDLQAALLATGDAYLLEHNAQKGRDDYWSDDHDGCGNNMLGKFLMNLRSTLTGGHGEPTPRRSVSDFTYAVKGDNLPPRKACQ